MRGIDRWENRDYNIVRLLLFAGIGGDMDFVIT